MLSRDALYADLREHMDEGEEITRYEYPVAGATAAGIALLHGHRNLSDLREMYRTAGIYGTMIERADDVIDGDHGFERVEDGEEFLYNALEVVETGERPETVNGSEEVVYRAAEHVNSILAPEQAEDLRYGDGDVSGLEDVVEATLEDRYSRRGYETHLDSAAYLFENMGLILDMITPYKLDGREDFWADTGRILQVTDDKVDQDWGSVVDTRRRQEELMEDMVEDHGRVPALAVSAADTVFCTLGEIYFRLE